MEGVPSNEEKKTFKITMPNGIVEEVTSPAEAAQVMERYHENEN